MRDRFSALRWIACSGALAAAIACAARAPAPASEVAVPTFDSATATTVAGLTSSDSVWVSVVPDLPRITSGSAIAPGAASGTTYYLSRSGNDRASGRLPDRAWRTLTRASRQSYGPGDLLLLEGGATFAGTLEIASGPGGTPEDNVLISSYGRGHATIDAGCGNGIVVRNLPGVRLTRLRVIGCGADSSSGTGVTFRNDLPDGRKLGFLRIDSLVIMGFGRHGLLIEGTGRSGFRDVRITRVTSTRNGFTGIEIMSDHYPYETEYAHEDVYIGFSDASDNPGSRTGQPRNGSGIIVSDVLRGIIERSRASGNGYRSNVSGGGGPVGIAVWNSSDITVQFSQSVGNRTTGSRGGAGFDLDGGVRRSALLYNYSHDNQGPGYMVMTFPDGPPTVQTAVRFNVSINDARWNGTAPIQVMGEARGVDIIHNAIFIVPASDTSATRQAGAAAPVQQGTARARIPRGPGAGIAVMSSQYFADDPRNEPTDVRVRENVMISSLNVPLFSTDFPSETVSEAGNRQIAP